MNVFVVTRDFKTCDCCGVESEVVAVADTADAAAILVVRLEEDRVMKAIESCRVSYADRFHNFSETDIYVLTQQGNYSYRVSMFVVQSSCDED